MNIDLHYPGGKKRIAPWIVKKMPDHHSYLEPFFGCGAVLFEKEPAPIETVNDLDSEIVNFFRVVRDPDRRERLCEAVAYTPYSREIYEEGFKREYKSDIEKALCLSCGVCSLMALELLKKVGGKKTYMDEKQLTPFDIGTDCQKLCSTWGED